ncbi:MAG: proteasome accessory factor PafA2 family protein, partial [Planctomycetota bacterium]
RRKGTRGRVHIICGDSVSSHRAAWLKAGTTALVVALAEGGLAPERRIRPRSPLGAMRTFARDADCNARIAGVTGRRLTAIEIQRTYLELAERHLGAPFMPPWAEEVCREWRRTLDSLERRPEALDATLDWRIKLALFRTHARSRGLPWEKVEAWNRVLGSLRPALPKRYRSGTPLAPDLVLSPASPIAGEVRSVTPLLLGSGLTWDGLVPFLRLREELFEIDVRFGQLGEEGIFRRLDAAGVLDHGAPGVENIDDAKERPPASTRARVRGDSVRRYSGGEGDYRCEWSGVWNLKSSSCLKLEDAFQTEAEWVKPSPGRSALPPVPAPSQPGNLAAHALSILADAQREQSPSELLRLNRQSCGSD